MTLFFVGVFVPPDAEIGSFIRATSTSHLETPHSLVDVAAARHIAQAHFGVDRIDVHQLLNLLGDRREQNPLYSIVGLIDSRGRWIERARVDGDTVTVTLSNGQWARQIVDAITSTPPESAMHITLARETPKDHTNAHSATASQ